MILDSCRAPIVLAPLAGGPSTPQLTAAVSEAGGLGFLAAGYLSADEMVARRAATRALTSRPFGINLFVPGRPSPTKIVQGYAEHIAADAASVGARLGAGRYDDDDWDAKIAALLADPPPVVSFTFGIPDPQIVRHFRTAGTEVWITIGSPTEAEAASAAGSDALVVQGAEAGGHRGGPDDDPAQVVSLLPLLQLVAASVDLPLIATGGIASGAAIAAVLCLGARAAAIGTAFLGCPEAGTSAVHREALRGDLPTAYTRAFTGRTARGIVNQFMLKHSEAPSAYPEIHHLTAPMRKQARQSGRADLVNLWAGQGYPLTRKLPASELVHALMEETRTALSRVQASLHL
ncbi:MAG TPA: nitronate monooxygenase [Mycobacterium sp.]|uniref:nitronate monooxygenase n=1 Tax=Mycobacterium sp. TaxID=1785 RepID=UPI002D56120B|nr:nitronate monooxygenase [Mycobacterium sp.]HZU47724.1 nitronate monooxygenase [Mycobacterium sp.]